MIARTVIVVLLAGITLPSQARQDPPDPGPAARALLRQALDLYMVGQYKNAAARLRPLVETRVLRDRADQLEALRTYGISMYLSGSRPGAERAFRALLRMDPGIRLNPSFVRPEVVAFFDSVRKRFRWEIKEALRKRGPKKSAVRNILPPWGQFSNGHRVKGFIFGSAELAFGATSLVSMGLLYSWRDKTGQFGDKESAAEKLQVVNWVSTALAWGVIIYAVIDGLYYYYRAPKKEKAPLLGAAHP